MQTLRHLLHRPLPLRNFSSLQKFDFKDPLNFDGLLTDDERMIQETARQYAQEKLFPRIKEAYQKEIFDVKIMKEMGDLGFLGCTIPEYDLPGVSSVAYGKYHGIAYFSRTY